MDVAISFGFPLPTMTFPSIEELVARKTIEEYGEFGRYVVSRSIITIPGFSALSDTDKRAICAKLEYEAPNTRPDRQVVSR
jgi:hypothetical protein